MNKRSKVLLIILAVIVLFVISTLLTQAPKKRDELLDFENEITNPDNTLDPLGENQESNTLLISVALKTESVIDKVFEFVTSVINSLFEKI